MKSRQENKRLVSFNKITQSTIQRFMNINIDCLHKPDNSLEAKQESTATRVDPEHPDHIRITIDTNQNNTGRTHETAERA